MSVLAFLLGDQETTDPRRTVEEIADAITAIPVRAALGAALHRLDQRPGAPGATWLVLLRVPDSVTEYPGGGLMLRVEEAVTAALGRQFTAAELPAGTSLTRACAAAGEVYDSRRGWITPAST